MFVLQYFALLSRQGMHETITLILLIGTKNYAFLCITLYLENYWEFLVRHFRRKSKEQEWGNTL